MRTLWLLVALCSSLPACDPPAAADPKAEKPAEPAAAATNPATPPAAAWVEESKANVTGDRTGHAACLSECKAPGLSATDQATCRLNCETAFKLTPTPTREIDADMATALACLGACHEGPAAQTPACVKGCRGAPTPTLERLGTCVGECYADTTLKATDRETCKLNCSQVAVVTTPPA